MQCPKCDTKNSPSSLYCVNCGWNFITMTYDKDYCPICKKPLLHPQKPCEFCKEKAENQDKCSLCKTPIGKVFWDRHHLSKKENVVLNMGKNDLLCKNCYELMKIRAYTKIEDYKNIFNKTMEELPIITMNSPINLTLIKTCRVVSAQTLVNRDIWDRLNLKNFYDEETLMHEIERNEKKCLDLIRQKTLFSGANAIVGLNISYSEINSNDRPILITLVGNSAIVEEFNILTEQELDIFREIYNIDL